MVPNYEMNCNSCAILLLFFQLLRIVLFTSDKIAGTEKDNTANTGCESYSVILGLNLKP